MTFNLEHSLSAALQAFQRGEISLSEQLANTILKRTPEHPQAMHLRALISFRSGNLEAAGRIWRRLSKRLPGCVEFHYNLGVTLDQMNKPDEAEAAYRRALQSDPTWFDAHHNLGLLMRRQGRLREAVTSFRNAIKVRPAHAGAYNNLGEALLELGEIHEARACLMRALEIQPDFAKAHNNLGKASSIENNLAEAATHFERSLTLDPNSASTWNNLGLAYHSMGQSEKAVASFERALMVRPDYRIARWNLCTSRLKVIYRDQQDVRQSRDAYIRDLQALEQACTLDSRSAIAEVADAVGATQPFYLAYQGEVDRDLQMRYGALAARIMAARYPDWAQPPKTEPPAAGEKIRVGFATRWFLRHSVWKIPVRGWVKELDRSRFQLFAYHTGRERDDQTDEAECLVDHFVRGPLSFESWCERIRRDRLHVLIFPEIGMDPMTVKLASLRLAPVQCSTWGHPDTTGLPTIDYYFSSELMEPQDAETHYSEQLVRLPNLSICYDPLPVATTQVTREQLGLPGDTILYWCPQSLYKYLPRYDEIFPRIARVIPRARFLFIRYQDGERVNEVFQQRLAEAFSACGLSNQEHCIYLPRLDSAKFDAVSGLCDVFLDSMGWSGCNTTLEAIARDLPVVTCPGVTMRSRHTAAFLMRMGISGATAHSLDDYVSLATSMGLDSARRHAAREELAARKHLLYHDVSCVRALESFLASACGKNQGVFNRQS